MPRVEISPWRTRFNSVPANLQIRFNYIKVYQINRVSSISIFNYTKNQLSCISLLTRKLVEFEFLWIYFRYTSSWVPSWVKIAVSSSTRYVILCFLVIEMLQKFLSAPESLWMRSEGWAGSWENTPSCLWTFSDRPLSFLASFFNWVLSSGERTIFIIVKASQKIHRHCLLRHNYHCYSPSKLFRQF